MSSATERTATLWQILMEKIGWSARPDDSITRNDERPATPPDLYNPLKLALGGFVRIDTPELMAATFSVEWISEFTRHIGGQKLMSVDYSLHDPDFGGEGGTYLTVRVIPQDRNELGCFVLFPDVEEPYSREVEAIIDSAGEIKVGDKVYRKEGAYEASLREVSSEGLKRLTIKYGDFSLVEGTGHPYYVAEMDLTDKKGLYHGYFAEPIHRDDVKPIAGHTSLQS